MDVGHRQDVYTETIDFAGDPQMLTELFHCIGMLFQMSDSLSWRQLLASYGFSDDDPVDGFSGDNDRSISA